MRTIIGILIVAALTYGAWHTAKQNEALANRYEQEASGRANVEERKNIKRPGTGKGPQVQPKDEEGELPDLPPLFVEVAPGRLEAVDPVMREKAKLAIQHREISQIAGYAVWVFPLIGLTLAILMWLGRRTPVEPTAEDHEPERTDPVADLGASGQEGEVPDEQQAPG